MDQLAQEYKSRPQEVDRLAVADIHNRDESDQAAAARQAERSRPGYNRRKHHNLGWSEE